MSTRTATWLAWSLVGLTFLLMAGTVFVVWLGRSSPLRADGEYSLAYQVIAVLGNALAPIVGALIAVRQARNPYGWIWLVSGFALSFMQFVAAYAVHGLLIAPGTLPLVEVALSLVGAAWFLYLATGPFVLLLFPTGQLPSRKWRLVAWMEVLAAFGATVRDETDLERLTTEMLCVVDATMQPEHVAMWLPDRPPRNTPGDARPDSLPPRPTRARHGSRG